MSRQFLKRKIQILPLRYSIFIMYNQKVMHYIRKEVYVYDGKYD